MSDYLLGVAPVQRVGVHLDDVPGGAQSKKKNNNKKNKKIMWTKNVKILFFFFNQINKFMEGKIPRMESIYTDTKSQISLLGLFLR